MANFYSLQLGGPTTGASGATGTVDGLPAFKPSATQGHGGRIRVFQGVYQLNGAAVTTADVVNFCIMPAGSIFQGGNLVTGVTLATSTVAIGIAGTTGKYRAAAVQTAVDTPSPFWVTANVTTTPLAADERIIGTIAVASLPTSGQFLICQMLASNG